VVPVLDHVNVKGGENRMGERRFPARYAPKPVSVGEVHEVDITEVSQRGDGVARIKGFVIFVPNTKKGDHVKVKITRVGNRFALAEVVQ